ncbi:MAG: prepilin-type N-terminal cleavage/methylation domain-containing protein [bacterium]|nr:prepilin-type N-terminal cleavage/methylation domain-containing protein [bacterium]
MTRKGFTLIELLIVVAIIGILASIAVPNFLNAMTRAKVARSVSDIRGLSEALEMYRLDRNAYPPIFPPTWMADRYISLTHPVAYMGSIPLDPFNKRPTDTSTGPKDGNNPTGHYDYWTRLAANGNTKGANYWRATTDFPAGKHEWILIGFGPSESWVPNLVYPAGHANAGEYIAYDMSNGLYSGGCIVRYGP